MNCTEERLLRRLRRSEPPPPPRYTNARPGSEEKILIMQDRVAKGFQPHHPLDADCRWVPAYRVR